MSELYVLLLLSVTKTRLILIMSVSSSSGSNKDIYLRDPDAAFPLLLIAVLEISTISSNIDYLVKCRLFAQKTSWILHVLLFFSVTKNEQPTRHVLSLLLLPQTRIYIALLRR